MLTFSFLFFFFFQAEDVIRDLTVTGVQTCALPICCCYCNAPCITDDDCSLIGGTCNATGCCVVPASAASSAPPASSVVASSVPASSVIASSVPASSVIASSVPASSVI